MATSNKSFSGISLTRLVVFPSRATDKITGLILDARSETIGQEKARTEQESLGSKFMVVLGSYTGRIVDGETEDRRPLFFQT